MVRVRSIIADKRKKKRVLKAAKGHFGKRSRNFSQAKRSVVKGMVYAYRDRKVKKREFRSLWIVRINAACRDAGIPYSRFIKGLEVAGIIINRKILSEMAIHSPEAFQRLVGLAKDSLPQVLSKNS
jgi:large subunit ribosomal protein L20